MKTKRKQEWVYWVVTIMIVTIPAAWWIVSASIQASVYRRQGVEMTTWECLMGAKPAERSINIKE